MSLFSTASGVKKFIKNYKKNKVSFSKDLNLVLENAWTIPYLFSPINAESSTKSEVDFNSYGGMVEILNVVSQVALPIKRETCSPGTISCNPEHLVHSSVNEKWFFINGIATSPPVAMINCHEIARVFSRPIHLIHTPTYGAVRDFLDSVTARTFKKDGELSRPAYNVIKQALMSHDKVIIVGHSQGTIVASYIARKLLKDKIFRHLAPKLEIYNIAGVADGFRVDEKLSDKYHRGVPYAEHFANELDFFSRIGILAYRDRTDGAVFCAEKKGHLLNDHYIAGLERGEYCNRKSRLFKYVNGLQPSDTDYAKRIAA